MVQILWESDMIFKRPLQENNPVPKTVSGGGFLKLMRLENNKYNVEAMDPEKSKKISYGRNLVFRGTTKYFQISTIELEFQKRALFNIKVSESEIGRAQGDFQDEFRIAVFKFF